MKFSAARVKLPSLANSLLAVLSAVLLTLAFPDFDLWFLAWFALVPLFYAVEREKQSFVKSFVLGWIFGTAFFFGSCWWLTFAPTTYGGVPAILSYLLLLMATLVVGIFPAIFSAVVSLFLKRFGTRAILSAPFLWTATEFLRFNLTGNNWNAIGYSQAFHLSANLVKSASIGGVYLTGFWILLYNSIIPFLWFLAQRQSSKRRNRIFIVLLVIFPFWLLQFAGVNKTFVKIMRRWKPPDKIRLLIVFSIIFFPLISGFLGIFSFGSQTKNRFTDKYFSVASSNYVIAVQPNVPMSGLKYGDWEKLRQRHIELAENALQKIQRTTNDKQQTIVIFPESPMNFEYESNRELKSFFRDFAVRNNASLLFNSAQPNTGGTNFFNSAVMINERGEKIAQYDKIHLVPFGETVPLPDALAKFVPTMVGNFETGENYNLFPLGDAKAGVMICFESHFSSLAREFTRLGADVLIEMTNDGYLGETPVLQQHLANAVFRAVETNRPVLRVTNVGITAYVNERGEVSDTAKPYTEDTRVWTISKSDGKQTFYVRYGDWFAWLCSVASLVLILICFWKRRNLAANLRR